MLRSVTICLLSGSLLLLVACASYPDHLRPAGAPDDCVEKFRPRFTADWYNASIDVRGHHISGLLLFKKMPDSTLRVVFTNEVGATFFDYEFTPDGNFQVKQAISQFKRKVVAQTLRKDIELILLKTNGQALPTFTSGNENWYASKEGKEINYFITDNACTALLRVEKTGKGKKKVEMTRSGKRHLAPDSVHLQHFTFNMQISLSKLNR